ncbi:hypothetical protein PUR43_27405, partial [Enterobacter hormaechei subsp. xiangfangensis]
GISNLFDKQIYRENDGASTYNEPGRAYYAGIASVRKTSSPCGASFVVIVFKLVTEDFRRDATMISGWRE